MRELLDKVVSKGLKTDSETEYGVTPYTLILSCNEIEFEMAADTQYQGSFQVVTDEKAKAEGYVYSEDLRMFIRTAQFGGLDREIIYFFDSTGLKEGSVVKGVISIVSNLGEYELPYTIHIANSTLSSNLGEIRNLFHFANLAKADWDQAVSLFYSENFSQILTGNDRQYIGPYKGLSALTEGPDGQLYANECNVNTFLELTRKKSRSRYLSETRAIEVNNPKETYYTELAIKRDGWGYTNLEISTSQDFIVTPKEYLVSEDFEDGVATIPVYIDVKELHRGVNQGVIVLKDFYNYIEIPVKVNVNTYRRIRDGYKTDTLKLMRLYVLYRLGRVSKNEWVKESSVVISHMLSIAKTSEEVPADEFEIERFVTAKLYQVHLFVTQKRENDGRGALEQAKLFLNENTRPEIIGYSLYLEYLLTKDDSLKNEYARNIELLYVQNKNSTMLAWLLLYVKEELRQDDRERLKLIKYQYEHGCVSPLMFVEALNIFIYSPSMITQLTDFELAIYYFAKKHDAMTGDMRRRLNFMASREVAYSREINELLVYSYEREPLRETLEEVCRMLMRGNRTGNEYFSWYEKAVESEIRINRLYEYYLMSIDLTYTGRLPKIILMYFAFRSDLDYERNAFLYANVLKHRPAYQDIYKDYLPAIKEFAKDQLKKCHINDNLAYIYKTALGEELYSEELVQYYSKILFAHYIDIKIPEKTSQVSGVIVINEHITHEECYAIYNGHGIIPLVGDDYCILVEDQYGNRYVDNSLYKVKRIVKTDQRMAEVMMKNCTDLYPALYLEENAYSGPTLALEEETALIYLTECDNIDRHFRLNIMIGLAEYYFDKDEISRLDELMLRFDPDELDGELREKCIHIMAARGMYDRALEWVCKYGSEYVDDKILLRLCDRILVRSDYEYDYNVLKICETVFAGGRYDETILKYLLMFKEGSSKSLKRLWRAADSFDLDVHGLLETMIVQILYSGADIGEEYNIFLQYVTEDPIPELEKLFLDKLSRDYFVKKHDVDRQVFDTVISLHRKGENLTDYIKIAFLKSCADNKDKIVISAEQRALIVLFMTEFLARHIMFPFFLEFRDYWSKLSMYEDRSFIEYTGDPGSKVILHYYIEDDTPGREYEFKREEMQHLLGGVYVKSFVLFDNESVRYYITEENARSEKLTRSDSLKAGKAKNGSNWRYDCINDILAAGKLKNTDGFFRLSEEYITQQFITEHLFTPDRGEMHHES